MGCYRARVVDMRGRYAPSPTGRLHLGNARTALLAWLQIRAGGGRFVMRVEDIEDPLMQQIRYLDKLVDELARGKAMDKVLREA